MQNPNPSEVLFVLGMHRSGTSAISRVFNLLGYAAPKTLMKANKSNVSGHWESTPIARLNDDILAAAGLDWSDWSLGRIASIRSHDRENFEADILKTLSAEYPRGRPAAVKDPRICRLLDVYKSALAKEEIPFSAVIPIRNPLAVAKSLTKRNGISELNAGLLWLRHVLDATQYSEGQNRVFVSYENFLVAPAKSLRKILNQLELTTPYPLDAVEEQISSHISVDLQHHSFGAIEVAHDPLTEGWINDAYQALLVLCNDPNTEHALERLSEIKKEFDQSNEILTTVSVEHSRLSSELVTDLDGTRMELRLLTTQKEGLEHDHKKLANENKSLVARFNASETELATYRDQIREAEANLSSALSESSDWQNRFETQQNENESLLARFNARETELATYRDQIREAEANLSSALSESSVWQNRFEMQQKANTKIEAELDQAKQHHEYDVELKAELEARIITLVDQTNALQEQLGSVTDRNYALDSQLLKTQKRVEAERDNRKKREEQVLQSKLCQVQKQFDEADNDLQVVNLRLKSREKELRQLERQFWRLKDELNWSKEIVQNYQNSTSWRVSAPLRAVSRLGQKIKSKLQAIPAQETAKSQALSHKPKIERAISGPAGQPKTKQSETPSDALPAKRKLATSERELVHNVGLLERSGAFDKAFYLANYPEAALHSLSAEGHYLLEGWKVGNRPNATFETKAYLAAHPELTTSDTCPLIHFIKNGGATSLNSAPSLNGASGAATKKNVGKIAVYTAISAGYDDLKEPENVSENTDYFVFTDGDVPAYSNWKPIPFEFVSHDPTRTARFVKTHPHLYFDDYDWVVWVDANLQLAAGAESLIPAEPRAADFYTWSHPLRTCVYQEAEECLSRKKDDSDTIKHQVEILRSRNFPERAGLFETSVIVSKMGSEKVTALFNVWWREISQGSKRDQLSLPYAAESVGLNISFLAREKICMRTDPRFVYYRHSAS